MPQCQRSSKEVHRSGEVMELSLSSSEMESSKSSKSSEIQLHIQQLVKNYASKLAQLDVTNPEVLRTTHAFCAFQGCAKALRVQCDGDFFHKSFKNDKIFTFWSHSWHGAQWKKILTLLSFYNGFAAVFCGFLAAILMMILFCLGFLPSLDRQFAVKFSAWCLPSGFAASTLVMLFWKKSYKGLFGPNLHQPKQWQLKSSGNSQLGRFAEEFRCHANFMGPNLDSEVMVPLWACSIFEKQKHRKAGVDCQAHIPGTYFHCYFSCLLCYSTSLDNCFVYWSDRGHVVRARSCFCQWYHSSLSNNLDPSWLLSRLGHHERAIAANFFRCNQEFHVVMQIIRVPVGAFWCVIGWRSKNVWKCGLGAKKPLKHAVRTEVLDILNIVLSEKVFTTTWILGVTSPFLWAFLDLSASFAIVFDFRQFWLRPSVTLFVEGLMLWLVALPSAKDVAIMICRFTRAKGRTQCLELLKNLMVVFACALVLSVFLALYFGTRFAGQEFERAVAWSGGVVFFSICFRLGTVAMKMILKDSDGKCSSAHSVFGKAEGSNSLDRWAMSKRVLQKRHGKNAADLNDSRICSWKTHGLRKIQRPF